jgi:hypothetical protein
MIVETLDRTSIALEDENIAVEKPRRIDRIIEDILIFTPFELPDLPDELELDGRCVLKLRVMIMDVPDAFEDLDREFRGVDGRVRPAGTCHA